MTDLDRTAVVMSIRGSWADGLIVTQEKRWEFRRSPLPEQVTHVLVNRSGVPAASRGVIGWFSVRGVSRESIAYWSRETEGAGYRRESTDPRLGLPLWRLADYARPTGMVWSIARGETVALPEIVPLSRLGFSLAPQSWRYAPEGWREMLR